LNIQTGAKSCKSLPRQQKKQGSQARRQPEQLPQHILLD